MANASYLKKFDPIQEGQRYAYGIRTGVRTAADFTITLGFKPTKIRVVNLTDRIEATHYVDPAPVTGTTTYGLDAGANAKSLLTVAAGTRTYEAAGISLTSDGMGFVVDVSVKTLETDDDDCMWECWG
jgi:hypothetical protein